MAIPPDASGLEPSVRLAISNRVDPVWVFDAEREAMVFGNLAACSFWRARDLEELVGRDYAVDMSDATRSRLAAVLNALERGEVVHEQWTFYPASKAPKTVALRAERVRLFDGRPAILFSVESADPLPVDALRGVEAVRHTTVMITSFDAQCAEVLFANPASLRAYGEHAPSPGLLLRRFADEKRGERILAELGANRFVSAKVRMRTRHGVRWHGIDARFITDPVSGDEGVLVNEKDIHDAKLAEDRLRNVQAGLERRVLERTRELEASRDFVNRLLDTIDSWVVVSDGQGRITRLNRRAADRLGKVVGQPVTEVLGIDSQGITGAAVETRIDGPDGERLVSWTTTPAGSVSPHRLVWTGVDITERRALQLQVQLADRLSSLGTLAAGVAHELNNPLAVVRANLEVLRDELAERDESAIQIISEALNGVGRAARIVADLRTYSRADEEATTVALRPLVRSAVALAYGPLQEIELRLDIPNGVFVRGVEGRLMQVVLNLVVNAAHAMAETLHPVLRLSVDESETTVRLVVEDNGPGIPPELVRRVFDPFFTTKAVGEGTGLGLFVCQQIVSSHGGAITFEQQAKPGARVVVTLPAGVPPRTPALRAAPVEPRGALRVLLVDDDRAVLRALRRLLRDLDVEVVESGSEALTKLRAQPSAFDVVLCDLMMPEMSGEVLYRTVLQELPELAARFVFMSGGLVVRSSLAEFVRASQRPFVDKPVDARALRRALWKVQLPAES